MSGSAPGRREVAYRVFAAEFDDAEFSYSESDEERAPNYVVTPTGARVNRLFTVGVLTEVDDVNPEMVRGRVVDPTGAFVTYAGQYQPDALAFLERADPPMFVALSGKARTFEPEDDDVVYSSVRPESVNEVDAETRDRWVVTAAERTLDRVGIMAAAIDADLAGDQLRVALREEGVDECLADGVALALEFYNTTPAYLGALRETALEALRVVAGDRDEVGGLDVRPGDVDGAGAASAGDLATLDLSDAPSPATAAAAADLGTADGADAGDAAAAESDVSGADTEDDAVGTGEEESVESGAAESVAPADAGREATDRDTAAEPTTDGATTDGESESTAGSDADAPAETADAAATTGAADAADGAEPAGTEASADAGTDAESAAGEDEPGEFEPGEFDIDEETRQEVEEEYGTEFSTADEVEAADIETADEVEAADPESAPSPDAAAEASDPATDAEPDESSEPATETGAEASDPTTDAEPDEPAADAPEATGEANDSDGDAEDDAADVDLEDAVMDAMASVGEGEGADREELVAVVVDEHGVEPAAVEDAIEDALMSGRCYEPSEGTLKAI